MAVTARADLGRPVRASVFLFGIIAPLVAILYLFGADLRSRKITIGFWMPVAVAVAVILLAFLWRAFWRLELRNGTLTWHMLTRKRSLPVTSIEEIASEMQALGDHYSHVLVLRANDGSALVLETGLWKERQLKAVIRELRPHVPSVAPPVQQWLG